MADRRARPNRPPCPPRRGGRSIVASSPVAFAGETGAFAEDAVIAAFGDVARTGVAGFREVFEAVERGTSPAGVLPIENSVNGSVREVYDLLLEHSLAIVGEVVVPVALALAALRGQTIEGIERVYSHIQALGQAERFLRGRPWTLLTTYNTAGSGRLIAERAEHGAAAVLSQRAAGVVGLEILADGIQDVADNRTRFIIVAKPETSAESIGLASAEGGPARTTLAFAVRNEPGTLLAALRCFAYRGVNLSNLESRPSRSVAWEYVFWADLDGAADSGPVAAALLDLSDVSTMVRVLGSYPRGAG
jgi:prephenate dehydratase